MESLDQPQPFIGPERVDARVGEHAVRSLEKHGQISLDQYDAPDGLNHFSVAWRNADGQEVVLYDGTSYLDAHRVIGYSTECINREFERDNVLPKITSYVDKVNQSSLGQLTQEDFAQNNLDAARERARSVEEESASEYR
jgi:hypothetical protein